jgi:hypothetical protein
VNVEPYTRTARLAMLVTWAAMACPHPAGPVRATPPPAPAVIKAGPAPEWDAKFAGREGWVGGDGAYSVGLGRRRVLWLFGDTLLGTVKDGGRAGAVMVNNTVGLQDGRDEHATIRFIAGEARDGKPAAVFLPPDGKGWLWPQAAVPVGGLLAVFLSQIERGEEPGVLGFRHVGQWLAVIENPTDEPSHWRKKLHAVPFARFDPASVRSWGSAVLAGGDFLYVYGYRERGKEIGSRELMAALVPAERLTDFASWRFRTADGWGEKPEDATPLAAGLATEFSVSPMPGGNGYVLVYTEDGLGDRVVGRFAREAAGPWSDPLLLYRCPEMRRDKGVFCYAAKAHPWATKDDDLLVSYCVNAWEFARLFRDEKVYRPRFVRVRLGPTGQ